ncbi:hypothetical protein B0H17DRAFT_1338605 [Mycena rosella]|uniref:F-box domain-containing protein n=1 Tax=Mycena rosella TaxID=1033263 RepID=A0AAD7G2B5_MYCRO|nr:hypothetical protein B0H17DRAFT_1338605 [Mycena rosella]
MSPIILPHGVVKNSEHPVSADPWCYESIDLSGESDSTSENHSISGGGDLPFVPFEVLAKIFIAFRDIVLEKSFPSIGAFLALSQVCGRWRAISHYTRALWTHLFFNFHSKRRYARLRKLVEQWVARSGTLGLSVHIRSCYPRPHNPVIDFVLAHAFRIRELSLRLPGAQLRPFLQSPPRTFPLLEKINLDIIPKSEAEYDPSWGESRDEYFHGLFEYGPGYSGSDFDDGILSDDKVTVLENAPRLRSLTIEASCTNLDSLALHLT